METATYKLKYPVVLGDLPVSELVLTPRASAWKGWKASGNGDVDVYATAAVAVRMAGQPTALLDLLHTVDMKLLCDVVASFLVESPPTGKGA